MQNDDDLRALAKIMAFMRAVSTDAPLLVLLWLFPRRKMDISRSR